MARRWGLFVSSGPTKSPFVFNGNADCPEHRHAQQQTAHNRVTCRQGPAFAIAVGLFATWFRGPRAEHRCTVGRQNRP